METAKMLASLLKIGAERFERGEITEESWLEAVVKGGKVARSVQTKGDVLEEMGLV